nr:putative integron gene cassette protein [uncultured bacterium]
MVDQLQAPNRGDLIWVSLNPQAGHEQAGRRPALVLSPFEYNSRVGLALMCPVTSRAKGYPFEVALPADLDVTGVILADQIKSLDWRARRVEIACRVPKSVTDEVLGKLGTLLS